MYAGPRQLGAASISPAQREAASEAVAALGFDTRRSSLDPNLNAALSAGMGGDLASAKWSVLGALRIANSWENNLETRRSYRAGIRGFFRWAYRTKRVPDHLADELPKVREQRGRRGRRGRGPTAYEAICLTSGMSSASTGIICSVRSVCALHTTHCRPNVTFRIGLSGNNLWKQSKQIF